MESPASTVAEPIAKPTVWGGWGQTATVPCPLEDVMSEELVSELQKKEKDDDIKLAVSFENAEGTAFCTLDDPDTTSDLLIAQMLQLQMDSEHDRQLKREENKWNGTSKVKVTFDKYRTVHPALQADADAEYDEGEVMEPREIKDVTPSFNRNGISGKGKNIVTKHDAEINSRKNVTRVMEHFPPGFETGDDSRFDMRLPNHVYNKLKLHSHIDNKRSQRLHEKKEHSTAELAVDSRTRLLMYKLVNAGVLNEIHGIISSGKESVVFHALGGSISNEMVPKECALKVFKTTLAEFKNRCQYVRGDVRFFKDEFKKQNPRKIMKIWAEKEELNLRRMAKFGIPCPTPVLLRKHILVMSFIGDNQVPAPILKEAKLSAAQLSVAYEQCIQHMKTMYKSCLLVHADLSEYNILWYHDRVYFIDVAQAVDAMHPHALEFLLRDCANICDFFKKKGVPKVPTSYELFNDVTGLQFTGEGNDFLSEIGNHEKDERTMQLGLSKTDYPFDYFFEKACEERQAKKDNPESSETDSDDEETESQELEAEAGSKELEAEAGSKESKQELH